MFAPDLGHTHHAIEAEGRVGEGQTTWAKEGEEREWGWGFLAVESRSWQHVV